MSKKVEKVAKVGRPLKYTGNVAAHAVGLVRRFNATRALAILNAENGTEDAALRSAKTVPAPLGISMPTLLGMAKRAGVTLKVGRPAAKKVAAKKVATEVEVAAPATTEAPVAA